MLNGRSKVLCGLLALCLSLSGFQSLHAETSDEQAELNRKMKTVGKTKPVASPQKTDETPGPDSEPPPPPITKPDESKNILDRLGEIASDPQERTIALVVAGTYFAWRYRASVKATNARHAYRAQLEHLNRHFPDGIANEPGLKAALDRIDRAEQVLADKISQVKDPKLRTQMIEAYGKEVCAGHLKKLWFGGVREGINRRSQNFFRRWTWGWSRGPTAPRSGSPRTPDPESEIDQVLTDIDAQGQELRAAYEDFHRQTETLKTQVDAILGPHHAMKLPPNPENVLVQPSWATQKHLDHRAVRDSIDELTNYFKAEEARVFSGARARLPERLRPPEIGGMARVFEDPTRLVSAAGRFGRDLPWKLIEYLPEEVALLGTAWLVMNEEVEDAEQEEEVLGLKEQVAEAQRKAQVAFNGGVVPLEPGTPVEIQNSRNEAFIFATTRVWLEMNSSKQIPYTREKMPFLKPSNGALPMDRSDDALARMGNLLAEVPATQKALGITPFEALWFEILKSVPDAGYAQVSHQLKPEERLAADKAFYEKNKLSIQRMAAKTQMFWTDAEDVFDAFKAAVEAEKKRLEAEKAEAAKRAEEAAKAAKAAQDAAVKAAPNADAVKGEGPAPMPIVPKPMAPAPEAK